MLIISLILFFKALFFGFVVAAPVGPVGAMVIKRTLKRGWWMGFFTGAGSAMGDTLYAMIVALGVSSVQETLVTYQFPISLMGGVILLIMGSFAIRKNLKARKKVEESVNFDKEMGVKLQSLDEKFEKSFRPGHSHASQRLSAMFGSFLITISNPVTIVGFAGTFAAFGFWTDGAPSGVGDIKYLTVVGGIMLGALMWWMSLAALISWIGNRLSSEWIFRIHVSTSLVIFLSGVLCLFRAFTLR